MRQLRRRHEYEAAARVDLLERLFLERYVVTDFIARTDSISSRHNADVCVRPGARLEAAQREGLQDRLAARIAAYDHDGTRSASFLEDLYKQRFLARLRNDDVLEVREYFRRSSRVLFRAGRYV